MSIHNGITPEQLDLRALEERYPALQYTAKLISTADEARNIRGYTGRYITFTGVEITEASLADCDSTGIKFTLHNKKSNDEPIIVSYKGYDTLSSGNQCEIELYKDKVFSFIWSGEYWIPNEELYYDIITDYATLEDYYIISDKLIIVDSDVVYDNSKKLTIRGMACTNVGAKVTIVNSSSILSIPIDIADEENDTSLLPNSYIVLVWTGTKWKYNVYEPKQIFYNPELVSDGFKCDWIINHNFNKNNMNVQVFSTSTGEEVVANTKIIDNNNLMISFVSYSNINENSYKVVIF